jgi:hypothetical protein
MEEFTAHAHMPPYALRDRGTVVLSLCYADRRDLPKPSHALSSRTQLGQCTLSLTIADCLMCALLFAQQFPKVECEQIVLVRGAFEPLTQVLSCQMSRH